MTIQTPEVLLYQGRSYDLIGPPLAQHPISLTFNSPGSFNHRGYKAAWEVKNDRLYLTAITAWRNDPTTHQIEEAFRVDLEGDLYIGKRDSFDLLTLKLINIFPESAGNPYFAAWYSGSLEAVQRQEDDQGHVTEDCLLFKIKSGMLKSVVTLTASDRETRLNNRVEKLKRYLRTK